jgi:hypothetical protein
VCPALLGARTLSTPQPDLSPGSGPAGRGAIHRTKVPPLPGARALPPAVVTRESGAVPGDRTHQSPRAPTSRVRRPMLGRSGAWSSRFVRTGRGSGQRRRAVAQGCEERVTVMERRRTNRLAEMLTWLSGIDSRVAGASP